MKPLLCFAIVLVLSVLLACHKAEPPNPYPVWILYVHALEYNDNNILEAVHGCPQVIFQVLPSGHDSTVNCEGNNGGVVKVWNHIDSTISIEYTVHCPNYYDSDPLQRTFRVEDAYQRPGRDGAEAMIVDTVIMTRQ